MTKDISIGIIGGDKRQLSLAKELERRGFAVRCFGVPCSERDPCRVRLCEDARECVKNASAVILGVPYSGNKNYINISVPEISLRYDELLKMLSPNCLLLGGRLDAYALELAEARGIRAIDYFELPELAMLNAIPSVEGALELAMRESEITLHCAKVCVLGYGRIGKLLAQRLRCLGAEVRVFARRREALCEAQANCHCAFELDEAKQELSDCDFIFNTVPSVILTRDILEKISDTTLIIDLASKPGGVDMMAAKELSKRVIWALSLPGKVAPVTAGKFICQGICRLLSGEGEKL